MDPLIVLSTRLEDDIIRVPVLKYAGSRMECFNSYVPPGSAFLDERLACPFRLRHQLK